MLMRATLLAIGLAATFAPPGAAAQTAADSRLVLRVTAEEARHVLEEMRGFLAASEAVLSAAVANDMKAAANAARTAGSDTGKPPPATLPSKLPAAFRQMGADTHRRFGQIALDADSMGDRELTLRQLAATLKNCTACHAGYRFEVGAAAK